MMDEKIIFNIFANTGNFEAYLLYKELNGSSENYKRASVECLSDISKSQNVFI